MTTPGAPGENQSGVDYLYTKTFLRRLHQHVSRLLGDGQIVTYDDGEFIYTISCQPQDRNAIKLEIAPKPGVEGYKETLYLHPEQDGTITTDPRIITILLSLQPQDFDPTSQRKNQ